VYKILFPDPSFCRGGVVLARLPVSARGKKNNAVMTGNAPQRSVATGPLLPVRGGDPREEEVNQFEKWRREDSRHEKAREKKNATERP